MATVPRVTIEVQLRGNPASDFAERYVRRVVQENVGSDRGNGWATYHSAIGYVEGLLDEMPTPDWEYVKGQVRESYNSRDFEWRVVLPTGEVVVELLRVA